MKSFFFKFGIQAAILVGSMGIAMGCGIEWSVPVNHFDGINEMGEFSYWRDIGKIDFGKDLKLPLIIGFKPTRGGYSCLGRGWIVPIFESNIVQIDEKKFLLTQPDGITRQFWRKLATDSDLLGQGNWKGEINGNTITLWADCGWKLAYTKGWLISITTPNNRTLNVAYNNGQASEIQEQGRTVLKVESNPQGIVSGLSFGGTRVGIGMEDKPRVDVVQGVNVVAGIEKSLHTLTFPGKGEVTYDFGVDEKIQPTLKMSGDTSRSFTWNPATGTLLRDGEWSYVVKASTDQWANAEIRRTNPKQQSEYWFLDQKNGQEITEDIEGITRTQTWFTSGVNLSGKPRCVQEKQNGVVRTREAYSYNENGDVIRQEIDNVVTIFSRSSDGRKLTAKNSDETIIWEKTFDQYNRVLSLNFPNRAEYNYTYLPNNCTRLSLKKGNYAIEACIDSSGNWMEAPKIKSLN